MEATPRGGLSEVVREVCAMGVPLSVAGLLGS